EGREAEPSLIDFDSDPQVNDTTQPSSTNLGFFSDIVGELCNLQQSRTPSLLDEDMTEDLPVSPDPDCLSLPSPQTIPSPNPRQSVSEALQEEHINEIQLQEPLPGVQDGSQVTSVPEEDSVESSLEDVTQGTDSENIDQATEPPPNEETSPQIPIIIVETIDELPPPPPSPPPPPPRAAPVEEGGDSSEGKWADNNGDDDDDDDSDSDMFEDAPQTPSDIVHISGEQEREKLEDEHLGEHYPLVKSIAA
ncbi:hypothetical protein L873DRAFT_1667691, partial [Choiromyces venosus 120613-1]